MSKLTVHGKGDDEIFARAGSRVGASTPVPSIM